LLVVSSEGKLTVVGNAGDVPRTLPIGGYCQPSRWWDARTVLVHCSTTTRAVLVQR
jgi:hypothetical protein